MKNTFRLFYERVQQKMTQRRARGRIFNQTQADKVSEVGRPLAAIQFGGLICVFRKKRGKMPERCVLSDCNQSKWRVALRRAIFHCEEVHLKPFQYK